MSKAEDRIEAIDFDDPRQHKAIVERESVRIVRRRGDLIIAETEHGWICANAGVDLSNIDGRLRRSAARRLRPVVPPHPRRASATATASTSPSSSPTPSAGPGAAGSPTSPSARAGITPIADLRGSTDSLGRELQVTEVCIVDELAGAADLVCGKASSVPVAICRGVDPGVAGRRRRAAGSPPPPERGLFR